MKCNLCGGPASLVGLAAGRYPAAFRCYNLSAHGGEHNFSADSPGVDKKEADRVAGESADLSRANAGLPQK